jgi:membrane-associated phospholipid phosphatase
MIQQITNLGDAALLLPATLLLFFHLLWRNDPTRAFYFACAIGICLAITIFAKLTFMVFAVNCANSVQYSPSGHTSFSAAFYGCFAALATSDEKTWRRKFTWTTAGALIIAIAVSRVVLGAHTIFDVMFGLAIGIACVALFVRSAGEREPTPGLPQLGACIALLAVLAAGSHLGLERTLRDLALHLGWLGRSLC